MEKNVFNNIWYVLTKTWKYEKRLIFIIILQIVIGAVVPLRELPFLHWWSTVSVMV